ncbi:MAG: hypothetical protein LBK23_04665 [Oscillospiraceae bacterium]|jgi:ribosomal silencing factor RsfS|nr:hypothetical protein [Oscillospiraceae bacterium]
MTGILKDLTFGARGEQHITVTVREDVRDLYDTLRDTEVEMTIKKRRKSRSLDSNGYAWVLIDKIAAALNLTKTEVYRDAIRDIGGVSETVCVKAEAAPKLIEGWSRMGLGWQAEPVASKLAGCVNVVLYYGSSVYDTRQMSALIDRLVDEAKNRGIEVATPEELARYAEEWAK